MIRLIFVLVSLLWHTYSCSFAVALTRRAFVRFEHNITWIGLKQTIFCGLRSDHDGEALAHSAADWAAVLKQVDLRLELRCRTVGGCPRGVQRRSDLITQLTFNATAGWQGSTFRCNVFYPYSNTFLLLDVNVRGRRPLAEARSTCTTGDLRYRAVQIVLPLQLVAKNTQNHSSKTLYAK